MRLPAAVMLLVLVPALAAQTIDREQSRFLTEPHGRPGTCAPYRLQFSAAAGSTATVEVHWGSVLLARAVPVPEATVAVVLPVPVGQGVKLLVRVGEAQDSHEPRLPPRSAAASHEQPYVAVFSGDPLYARAVLPSSPGQVLADYFATAEFFDDWRLGDGYDALVLFNPDDARLPHGAQRAIAEYCSLGGAVFVAGSFRFGEQAGDLPAPGDPEPVTLRDVPVQRFEYGAGAIYRCEWEALRKARSAQQVIRDAVLDHLWQGAEKPPGGPAHSRALAGSLPLLEPGPMAQGGAGPLFWVLATALVMGCVVGPLLMVRVSKAGWLPGVVVIGLCAVVGGLGATQSGPQPGADQWSVALTGPRPGGPAALRSFVVSEPAVPTWRVDLTDTNARPLPRPLTAVAGRPAWLVDLPLAASPQRGKAAELRFGVIEGLGFRDFATAARGGEFGYARDQGRLLDWWLENHAWRGRMADLAPCQITQAVAPPGCQVRAAGAIAITTVRWQGGN